MSDGTLPAPPVAEVVPEHPVPLADIERELGSRVKALQSPGEAPLWRSCLSNLVIYCDRAELAKQGGETVPEVGAIHPARVRLLVADPPSHAEDLSARRLG